MLLIRNPVSRVSTREEASCASGERLFGPSYGERNAGCHCVMMFAWPDSQMRSDSKCGNKVVGSSEDETSGKVGEDCMGA